MGETLLGRDGEEAFLAEEQDGGRAVVVRWTEAEGPSEERSEFRG
jgi:hypothetical protein